MAKTMSLAIATLLVAIMLLASVVDSRMIERSVLGGSVEEPVGGSKGAGGGIIVSKRKFISIIEGSTAGGITIQGSVEGTAVARKLEGIFDKIKGTAGKVTGKIKGTAGKVTRKVKGTAGKVTRKVKGTAGKVTRKVKGTAGKVARKIKGGARKVTRKIKGSAGKIIG